MNEPERPDPTPERHRPENHPRGLTRDILHKTHVWGRALAISRFYMFGEIGNFMYTVGKSILEGAVLYTMFSMAQTEYKVAAILGVLTKYIYPGITFVSSVKVSSFVDYLESILDQRVQIDKLIRALALIGFGQALGAIMLVLCFPPFFEGLFNSYAHSRYILILLYLLHHICDGSAQVAEGRIWFKLIEIKIRYGRLSQISDHFWGIHAMSQNIQLLLGLALLWGTTLVTGIFREHLQHGVMYCIVMSGLVLTAVAKFSLPLAWKLKLTDGKWRNEQTDHP
mgnify:FL=1